MAGGIGLKTWFRSGAANSALALGAFGVAALTAAPAQACFFISNGTVQFNSGLMPPCPSGFFDNFGAAQTALNAMSGGGGPTTTPSPTVTPTVPTTAPGTTIAPGTPTTVTSDNLFQILGTPLSGPGSFFDEIISGGGGSGRYSDYGEDAGRVTFGVGFEFAPIRDLRFRGDYTRTVRAPNVQDLFAPTGLGPILIPPLDEQPPFKTAEGAPPTPRERAFLTSSSFGPDREPRLPFGNPLPTVGTGAATAGYDFDADASEFIIRLDAVSDNGLQYSARVEIPVEKPAEPSPPPDRQSKLAILSKVQSDLAKVAILLYADEARAEELYRELTAAGHFDLTPEQRRAIRDIMSPFVDSAEAAKPLDEAVEDLKKNPISGSGETRLSGGVVLLGGPPAEAGSFAVPHVLEVSGETRGGVPFDFQIFGADAGGLSGPPAAPGGPPVVQIFTFGEEGQPQGLRYVADVDGAISAAGAACPPALSCQPRKATITVDGTGGSIGLIHQLSGSAPAGAPPDLIVSDFGFTPGGPVQGTTTLFQAPPQPAALPPVRLPVASAEGSGVALSDALARSLAELSPYRGGVRVAAGDGHIVTFGPPGGPPLPQPSPDGALRLFDAAADLSSPYRFGTTVAPMQPDGSGGSIVFAPSWAGGVAVTSNGVQVAGTVGAAPAVVADAQPKGTLTGSVLGGTPRPPGDVLRIGAGDSDQRASQFFLDAFIADPAGGRGSANAGAPPPRSGAAPAARPGRASGKIRLSARDGVSIKRTSRRGPLRANLVSRGATPNGPTYGVRISADPAQPPAQRPGVTGALGGAALTVRDDVVSTDFDVDVRGVERLTERACQGAALACGGAVRDVTFSFDASGGAPIVDVAIGLDAEGRIASRETRPGGILLVTLSPNGGAGLATAKVFQSGPGGTLLLVDIGPSAPVPAAGSPEERLSEGVRVALAGMGPQTGRIALNQASAEGPFSSAPLSLSPPRLQ